MAFTSRVEIAFSPGGRPLGMCRVSLLICHLASSVLCGSGLTAGPLTTTWKCKVRVTSETNLILQRDKEVRD